MSIDQIKDLANKNYSVNQILCELNISLNTYRKIIKEAGYVKPYSSKLKSINIDEIEYLLKDKIVTKKEICSRYNISYNILKRIENLINEKEKEFS